MPSITANSAPPATRPRGRSAAVRFAEERDRRLVGLLATGITSDEAGRLVAPRLDGYEVNIRMSTRRKQGWDIPRRSTTVRRKPPTGHWTQRTHSLSDAYGARDEILAEPGIDVDHDDISAGNDEASLDEALAAHLDSTLAGLELLFSEGPATLHRAIMVDDVVAFVAGIGHEPLGSHWTPDRACATTSLHGGALRRHEIMLTAMVDARHVDWASTIQMRLAHPCEMEVTVDGRLRLIAIEDIATGRIVARPGRSCLA